MKEGLPLPTEQQVSPKQAADGSKSRLCDRVFDFLDKNITGANVACAALNAGLCGKNIYIGETKSAIVQGLLVFGLGAVATARDRSNRRTIASLREELENEKANAEQKNTELK
jgi:hypothetical protein